MRRTGVGVQPIGEREEALKCADRQRLQHQRQRVGEAPRIADQIPKSCEATDALQVGETELGIRQNVVRRLRVVAHGERIGVANNRRATQAFQHADLNLVWAQTCQRVEAFAETRKCF